jgi:tight adherence protein C
MYILNNFLGMIQINYQYGVVMAFIFITVASMVCALYLLLFHRNIISGRLARISLFSASIPAQKINLLEEESAGVVAKTIKYLHNFASPKETSRKKKIRYNLMQAGFRSRQAYRNFLTAKIILAVLLPCIYLVVKPAFIFSPDIIAIFCILFVIGYFTPSFLLSHFKQKRQERVFKSLPDALDLMNICVAAGLGLDMTFKRVGDELRSLWKDLSDEFYLTNLEIRAGMPREESYKNMSRRTGVSEVQSLMGMLIQTSKFGTSVSAALRVHSAGMRMKRRQLAEEKAAQIGVKMILPLVIFIFPALFIVLVGPAGITIFKTLLPAMRGGG